MNRAARHGESERHAMEAAEAMRRGEMARANARFAAAARAEIDALSAIGPNKPRTLGTTAVSAVSLLFKSGQIQEAALLAHRMSATPGMPRFAQDALKDLLLAIWYALVAAGEVVDHDGVTVGESTLWAVGITPREYAILEFLLLSEGTVRTKEDILHRLYPDGEEPELKIVDVFLTKLRKKLSAAGLGGLIETVWGRGYVVFAPRHENQPAWRMPAGAGRSSAA